MGDDVFTSERVRCCVCAGTGKTSRLIFWSRPCSVCDGTGKRRILTHKNLTDADRDMVIHSAGIGSANYRSYSAIPLADALFGPGWDRWPDA